MKHITYIYIIFLFFPIDFFAEGGPKKDTLGNKSEHFFCNEQITKLQLLKRIDSLLELEIIDDQQIELTNYYHNILMNTCENSLSMISNMPAINFYPDFDNEVVFNTVPSCQLPAIQIIKIESDSLGSYNHPKNGFITSKFGWRNGHMHSGVDIDLDKGDDVVAAFDGMVRIAKDKGSYGKVVIIRHYNGLETVYAHLSSIKVKPGQVVLSGQLIGLGGSTGRSSGPHLHFEVRFKGHALNPLSLISFTENKTYTKSIIIKKFHDGIKAFPVKETLNPLKEEDCDTFTKQ